MNQYTLIDEAGWVAGEFYGSLSDLLRNLRPGHSFVPGMAKGNHWTGSGWLTIEEPSLSVGWSEVRQRRNELLAATDWRSLRAQELGVPLDSAWIAYRQALRDITQQPDPHNIIWPQTPAEGSE